MPLITELFFTKTATQYHLENLPGDAIACVRTNEQLLTVGVEYRFWLMSDTIKRRRTTYVHRLHTENVYVNIR